MELSLPLTFSLILTVASRLLHPYSADDKTTGLMVKQFSTSRDTQGGSQSYMEKRRGRREIEVTKRRGENKRGVSNLASNQFPMFSPQSGTLREVQSFIKKRRGKKEIEVTRRRRVRVKRGKTNLVRTQFSKCSPQPRTPREIHRAK